MKNIFVIRTNSSILINKNTNFIEHQSINKNKRMLNYYNLLQIKYLWSKLYLSFTHSNYLFLKITQNPIKETVIKAGKIKIAIPQEKDFFPVMGLKLKQEKIVFD